MRKIREKLRMARFWFYWLKCLKLQRELYRKKREQSRDFARLRKKFKGVYDGLSGKERVDDSTDLWRWHNEKISKALLPLPKENFLHNPLIMKMMFVSAVGSSFERKLTYIEKRMTGVDLKDLLMEDLVGRPLINNKKYLSSPNVVQQMYHVARFRNSTGVDLEKIKTIVEWGAGYGCMAKLWKRMRPGVTYIAIDTPLFCALQWLCLSVIFGENEVNVVFSLSDKIKKGKINIVSSSDKMQFNRLKCDLFISTWGLSESPAELQNLVNYKQWFGARHLLLAYQKRSDRFPVGERIGVFAKEDGARVERMFFLPNSRYAFL